MSKGVSMARLTKEREAEIREAVREWVPTLAGSPPVVHHRAELLAEIDALRAERDAARKAARSLADLATPVAEYRAAQAAVDAWEPRS